MNRNNPLLRTFVLIVLFLLFVSVSVIIDFQPGRIMAHRFLDFFLSMAAMFPAAFILIGLFEVWVQRSMVEQHLGEQSGWRGYFWAIVLASSIMAPMIIALPAAHALQKKGARLSVVLCFIGATTICRIPMTIFEATFLGFPFSLVRWTVSLPLIVISSAVLGGIFRNRGSIYEPE